MAVLWEREIIAQLRTARRALDKSFEGLDGDAVQRLRQAVRATELEAERALLDALESLSPTPSGAEGDLVRQLADLVEIWNGHKAPADVRDLAASLKA
jgi:hypothetical protein